MQADLSGKAGLLRKACGVKGNYWILEITVGIRFGGTELEAFVEWNEEVWRPGCIQLVHDILTCFNRRIHLLAMLLSFQTVSNKY